MRSGDCADLLPFFSAATHNPTPITAAESTRVAQAQYAAMRAAPGGGGTPPPAAPPGQSTSGLIWAVLAVVILASTLAVPLVLRRRSRTGTGPALRSEQD